MLEVQHNALCVTLGKVMHLMWYLYESFKLLPQHALLLIATTNG